MDDVTITLIATGLIFVFLLLGAPVFAALALAGITGLILVEDSAFVLNRLKSYSYAQSASYLLTVIPLFILMGAFAHHAGWDASCSTWRANGSATCRAGWPSPAC